jgi:ribosomal protein L31
MPDRTWSHDCWSFWFDKTKNAEEDALFEKFQKRFLKGVPNLDNLTGTT